MSSKHRHIFKLEIICGLALIQKEVCCDTYSIKEGTYLFVCDDTDYCDGIIAQYPIVNTIIHSVELNPDFEEPERPNNAFFGQRHPDDYF